MRRQQRDLHVRIYTVLCLLGIIIITSQLQLAEHLNIILLYAFLLYCRFQFGILTVYYVYNITNVLRSSVI